MVNAYAWLVDRAPYEFAEVQLLAELPLGLAGASVDIGVFGAVMNGIEGTGTGDPDLDPSPQMNEFVINRGSMVVLGLRD
jgi:hypothetical protein